jgi:predicted DNA-binding transcriptional regulator AlpA
MAFAAMEPLDVEDSRILNQLTPMVPFRVPANLHDRHAGLRATADPISTQEGTTGQPVMQERIQSGRAKQILGISLRSVQNLAARGELPSAAKFKRSWTFDEAELRRYVAEREEANRQQAAARAKPCPPPKRPVSKVPSYASLSTYASALGISAGDLTTKRAQRSRSDTSIAR